MTGIDTNLLVRYITQDGPEAKVVSTHLEAVCTQKSPGFIPLICMCELVWVLDRAYRYSRGDIAAIVARVLETDSFEVESSDLAWKALSEYRTGPADYSDYLIAQVAKKHDAVPVYTLDRKAARSSLFKIVG